MAVTLQTWSNLGLEGRGTGPARGRLCQGGAQAPIIYSVAMIMFVPLCHCAN